MAWVLLLGVLATRWHWRHLHPLISVLVTLEPISLSSSSSNSNNNNNNSNNNNNNTITQSPKVRDKKLEKRGTHNLYTVDEKQSVGGGAEGGGEWRHWRVEEAGEGGCRSGKEEDMDVGKRQDSR